MAGEILPLEDVLSASQAQGTASDAAPSPGLYVNASITDLLTAAHAYQTLPRLAQEQLIEQLGMASREREAAWHCRAFPINHPKNYTAVPTPDAKKAKDELVRIYNDVCMKGDNDMIMIVGKARGLNPLVVFADAHPAKVLALGLASIAGVFYTISQIGPLGEYIGK